MSLFDRVLAIDEKNAYALTWKAALQLEYGNWNTGQQLVQQAMAIRQDIPELLELLSRVLDSATQQTKEVIPGGEPANTENLDAVRHQL